MTVPFDHAEIESLLTEIETSTGRAREDVLLDALRKERERIDEKARRIAEGLRIDQEFRQRLTNRPLIDARAVDEIVPFDQNGLPV